MHVEGLQRCELISGLKPIFATFLDSDDQILGFWEYGLVVVMHVIVSS